MSKLLLLSVLIALISLPIWAARDRNIARGLKRAMFLVVTFNLIYVILLRFIYPRLLY